MNRAEHLAWAKERALEYADNGDAPNALGSLISDLTKHEDTAGHPGIALGGSLMMNGHLNSPQQVREFIEGFN